MVKTLDTHASFQHISLIHTFQSFLNSLFYLVYSSFWSVTPFSRPVKLVLFGFNLSFLMGALAWFFKITKVAPFESAKVLCKNPLSSCICLSFHQQSSCIATYFRQLFSLCWSPSHLVLAVVEAKQGALI